MRTIHLDQHHWLSYPVGVDIRKALIYARDAADKLNRIYSGHNNMNILCRGSSGAILAALSCAEMNNPHARVIHIKKEGEFAHSNCFEYFSTTAINIIIDDFISTGSTIRNIYEAVQKTIAGNIAVPIHTVIITRGWYNELGFIPDNLITNK